MPKYTHLGGCFWKSDSKVFCEGEPLVLDPAKTRVFFDKWATDGKRVYYATYHRRSIDPSSFVALNGLYAKDAKACYVRMLKSIPKADPATFEVLDSGCDEPMFGLGTNLEAGYAKDAQHVFFNGNLLKTADPDTFVSLQSGYGRDATQMFCGGYRLTGAVPMRWRYLGGKYSRDDKRAYYEHRQVRNVRVAFLRQIEPFDNEYAYDGKNFFDRGKHLSAEKYVEFLNLSAASTRSFAEIVANGHWQRTMYSYDRWYREPDETLFRDSDADIDDTQEEIEARLGPGEVLAADEWREYFQDLQPEANQQVLLWRRGRHKLVCIMRNRRVVGASFIDHDEEMELS